MSQAFMESSFPLVGHEYADTIRQAVTHSLYGENADPSVSDWSNEAVIYTRSSWSSIWQALEDKDIKLTPQEESDLINFASDYASLVDSEDDMTELEAIRRNEGEE